MSLPRLLVLTSTLPRWEGDTEPAFVEALSFELARSFDVTVLAPHARGAALDEQRTHGNRTIRIRRFRYFVPGLESLAYGGGIMAKLRRNPLRILLVPFFLIAQLTAMARLHRQHRFNVVQAHWLIPQGLVASCMNWVANHAPPYVVTAHGSDLYMLGGSFMVRLKQRAARRAARVTVVSSAMRDKVEALGVAADDVVVRSMGVDLQTAFTPGDEMVRDGLVFVGRLVDVKGVPVLIDAMARLAADRPGLQLTVVGDGPERPRIEDRISALGLRDHIHLAGSLHHDEIIKILRGAKILIMPSVVTPGGAEEGFGLVAVEAMGCGCAVVASDLAGIRDAVRDHETGLLAKPGDAPDLARKISTLLDDDALRGTLSRNARAHASQNYDWRIVGEDYAKLLLATIARG